MIDHWKDSNEPNPYKLIGALYELGIATREQLAIVLEWKQEKVRWTIDDMRRKAKREKKNPDDYIRFWPYKGKKNVYTLGDFGIRIACDLLQIEMTKWKRKPRKGNEVHTIATNQILIRMIKQDCWPDWYDSKGVYQWLGWELSDREFVYDASKLKDIRYKKNQLPIAPDAMILLPDGLVTFIEYDTGSQKLSVIKSKFDRYFQLQSKLRDEFKVIFVTAKNVQRVEHIKEQYLDIYVDRYENKVKPFKAFVFREGGETSFLCGSGRAYPIGSEQEEDIYA